MLLENNIKYIKGNNIKRGVQLGSEIIRKSLGRLPFITRKGHLVLSSEYVKQGDVVALIKGSQVPFILRRESDGHIINEEAIKNSKWCDVNII
ncbi:hypothetical protein DL95DRAFT_424437 [Leptodontidium sp. 2 PMI_412]|nr:hypothetical protein DL95DRAFT_424437 [Leptodontidium sp. 2 PMI_412]